MTNAYTCPDCNGSGHVLLMNEELILCPTCDGSGWVRHPESLPMPESRCLCGARCWNEVGVCESCRKADFERELYPKS